MRQSRQLITLICTVVLISAFISHSLIRAVGIETTFGGYWVTGPGQGEPSVFMAGSSLAGDGLSWKLIAEALNVRIGGWGVAGSSPSEWERYQTQAPQARLTILVVSPYDLNENFLCDFRANVVSLRQTIMDLWEGRHDQAFCKRLLSPYIIKYLRLLYPTLGRSAGIMGEAREKLTNLLVPVFHINTESAPTLSLNADVPSPEYKKQKISSWSRGRMSRKLADIGGDFQGKHTFDGPKRLAFERMLRHAQKQGLVVVAVLPVSPAYSGEFLTKEVKRKFEEALTLIQHGVPDARWIRLDRLQGLNSNDYFWDLVHMNIYGQQIATDAFLKQLGGT